jgi:hypothetical protein
MTDADTLKCNQCDWLGTESEAIAGTADDSIGAPQYAWVCPVCGKFIAVRDLLFDDE